MVTKPVFGAVFGLLLVDERHDALVVEGDDGLAAVGGGATDLLESVGVLVVVVAVVIALLLVALLRS